MSLQSELRRTENRLLNWMGVWDGVRACVFVVNSYNMPLNIHTACIIE